MNFKCGFYAELEELRNEDVTASFGFLDNLRVTNESSAFKFLHGCCDEFAAILSDVYGYDIECVRNADGRLIHAYCVSYIGEEKAYIDIRGITTDPALFFEEFKNELFYYPATSSILVEDEDGHEIEAEKEIWASKNELFDGEYEHWDDPEIEAFIKDYTDYYDSDQYISIFRCKDCAAEFEVIDDEDCDWFDYYGEEALWGHIQLDHPELYEECQSWETPDMLEVYYDHIIEKKSKELERLELGESAGAGKRRSLDALISEATIAVDSRRGPDDSGPSSLANEVEPLKKLPDAISR